MDKICEPIEVTEAFVTTNLDEHKGKLKNVLWLVSGLTIEGYETQTIYAPLAKKYTIEGDVIIESYICGHDEIGMEIKAKEGKKLFIQFEDGDGIHKVFTM